MNKKIIYMYQDKWNGDVIVYIGKDSNGGKKKRHNYHLNTKTPTKFERALQSQPDRYRYVEIAEILCDGMLEDIESLLIFFCKKFGTAHLNQEIGFDRDILEVLNDSTTKR